MKKNYVVSFSLLLMISFHIQAQISQGGKPVSFSTTGLSKNIDIRMVTPPDMEQIIMEDIENDGFGKAYRMGVILPLNVNPENSGTWETLHDGSYLWRLQVEMGNPEASNVLFDKFVLPPGAKLFVYTTDKSYLIGAFTEFNNHESSYMATQMIPGGSFVIELYMPQEHRHNYELELTEVGYNYRATGFNQSNKDLSCMVNVKCPSASAWTDQIRGAAKIQIRISTSYFLCSGSLVNTTTNSCQPYFLLADHCAFYNSYASTANMNQWIFYFNYESSSCTGTTGPTNQTVTGCSLKAHDTYGSGGVGSDFYLVLINNNIPSNYLPYYSGWNKSGTAATSGAGIHHPEGVIKKFSIYSTTLVNQSTHWGVTWANQPGYGHSVTAEGSSGSPIFDQNKLIVGTLTGGGSYCSTPTSPDYYGKFSYHWQSNGTSSNKQLKPWLDPINANPASKPGVNYNNCSGTSVEEIQGPNLNIRISPNPASDEVAVKFENYYFDNGIIRIYDILGNVIAQYNIANYSEEISFTVRDYPNGIYFISAGNSDHNFTGKFMISR